MIRWSFFPLILFCFFGVACNNNVHISAGNVTQRIPQHGWIKQYGAVSLPADTGHNHCLYIARDSSGNIYCSGGTTSSIGEPNGGAWDPIIMKFDPEGNIIWTRQFGTLTLPYPGATAATNDGFWDIVIDSQDNLVAAGYSLGNFAEAHAGGQDLTLIKLDPDGNQIWAKQYGATTTVPGGSNAGDEDCNSIRLDASDNIICIGYTTGAFAEAYGGGAADTMILKLDRDGNFLWAKQFGALTTIPGGNNAGDEEPNAVAVDSSGNIFVAGTVDGSFIEAKAGAAGTYDAFALKLDPTGSLLWATQMGATTTVPGGSNVGNEYIASAVVDLDGNLIIAGSTNGSFAEGAAGSNDALAMKFNGNTGSLIWATQLGATTVTPGGDATLDDGIGSKISVDSQNNILLPGMTQSNLGEPVSGTYDAFVLKLAGDGSIVWLKQFGTLTTAPGGDNSGDESFIQTIVDSYDNSYSVGYSTGSFAEANAGGRDLVLVKLTSDGTY